MGGTDAKREGLGYEKRIRISSDFWFAAGIAVNRTQLVDIQASGSGPFSLPLFLERRAFLPLPP